MENFFKLKYLKYKSKYLNIFGSGKTYPIIKPFNNGFIDVGNGHKIYFEESGNPNGIPFINLHGGPGGGLSKRYSQWFNCDKIRLIGIDQRGCGRSTPLGCVENNTSTDLVNDLEKVRQYLKIDKWFIVGGSWGSTLALLYAISFPDRVSGMVINSIYLGRNSENDWLFKNGASNLYPEVWNEFKNYIPINEQNDLLKAYYNRIHSNDTNAINLWCKWERSVGSLKTKKVIEASNNLSIAKIETHYFINNCFFPNKNDNYILDNINKIYNIPIIILHGRFDVVCPLETAHTLHKAIPQSDFRIINFASHDAFERPFNSLKAKAIDDILSSTLKM